MESKASGLLCPPPTLISIPTFLFVTWLSWPNGIKDRGTMLKLFYVLTQKTYADIASAVLASSTRGHEGLERLWMQTALDYGRCSPKKRT